MIKLKRPSTPKTLAVSGKAETLNLKKAYTSGERTFQFTSRIYAAPDVRHALRKMHWGKCAFCESVLPQLTAGHVEHFRPKGGVQQEDNTSETKPGYFWLAYDWHNLLLACEWCNCRAKRKIFPLGNPLCRALSHKDKISQERPLLIDPSKTNPASHLEFVGEEIRERNGSILGKTSIRVYRLDDSGLTEERLKKLNLFRALRDLARFSDPKPEIEAARAEAKVWTNRITSGKIEYAAMLRENL